jgi:hypothetical protein
MLASLAAFAATKPASSPALPPLPRADVPDERPLSPENARRLLEWDWLYQADGKPTAARSLAEVGWARELAQRLSRQTPSLDFAGELAELSSLETKLTALSPTAADDQARGLYFAVRQAKRRITLKNPLLDFSHFLVIERPYPPGQIHQSDVLRGPTSADTVGRIVVVEGFDLTGKVRDLMPGHEGVHWRPDLSYDSKKIVFSYKPKADKAYHLYEINIDGTGLRQLTNHPTYDDLTPIYLPDGHIMFCTTRGNTFVRCLPRAMVHVLARCDADGKNIYIISRNSENDWFPAMLSDGRVIYTRWEYTERQLWHIQKLWVVNPDGTGEAHYWGNGTAEPEVLTEAMPIPGTNRVMFTGTDHHHWFLGGIGVVDESAGRDHNKGIWMVTPDSEGFNRNRFPPGTPTYSPRYHTAGKFYAYRNPVPLGPEDFLVSATDGNSWSGKGGQGPPHSWLYLMDIHGNRELIHYNGKLNVFSPVPIRPRVKPNSLASRVVWPKGDEKPASGLFYSPNVLEGVPEIPPGKAKYLRVIEQVHRTYTTGGKTFGAFQGPGTSATQADAVKRVLGTVALEADGSVYFRVPSGKALYFQLLDEHYRCLQIMRSFTGVMPGEQRSCLGCHQQEHTTPPSLAAASMALRRGPVDITPPPWGAEATVGYERFAQPVLDKYCGKCHQGDGKGRAKLDLTLRAAPQGKESNFPPENCMKEPYFTLLGKPVDARAAQIPADHPVPGAGIAGCMYVEYGGRGGTAGMTPLRPMTMLSSTSPLIEMVMSGKHNRVKIEGEDLLKLVTWVDMNCVYRGMEEIRQLPARGCRDAPTIERLRPVSDAPATQPARAEAR